MSSGGAETILDVGGMDATEAFEDVGHSDEARELLSALLIGVLKKDAASRQTRQASQPKIAANRRYSSTLCAVIAVPLVLVAGAYLYPMAHLMTSGSMSFAR